MIRGMLWVTGCVCSVALAAAPLPVYAEEWIGSQSEIVGSFNNDDNIVQDMYQDLMEDLSDSGIDFVSPSPSGSIDQEIDQSPVEGSEEDFVPDSFPTPFINDVFYGDSNDSISDVFSDDTDLIDPLANYVNYYGAISSTYLEYMRGFLPKLGFSDHYVAARTGQYEYIFAYGDIQYTGSLFRGDNVKVISFNTYNNGSYTFGVQSSFNINPSSYMLYSDLSDFYPSLTDSAGFTSRQILILLTIMGLVWTIDHMYQVRKIRRLK